MRSVLASILDDAVQDGRLARNPARAGRVGLPRRSRSEHRSLSRAEVRALTSAAGDRGPIVLVLAYTGIRWGRGCSGVVEGVEVDPTRFAGHIVGVQ